MKKSDEIVSTLENIKERLDDLEENQGVILSQINALNGERTIENIERSHNILTEKYSSLDEKLQENIKRVNFMLLEMKGVIAIVRPQLRLWVDGKIVEHEEPLRDK